MIDSVSPPADPLERVDVLASALLDQAITEKQIRELGVLLEQEPAARKRYIENMHLHCDLVEHYAGAKQREVTVLGSLGSVDSFPSVTPIISPTPES